MSVLTLEPARWRFLRRLSKVVATRSLRSPTPTTQRLEATAPRDPSHPVRFARPPTAAAAPPAILLLAQGKPSRPRCRAARPPRTPSAGSLQELTLPPAVVNPLANVAVRPAENVTATTVCSQLLQCKRGADVVVDVVNVVNEVKITEQCARIYKRISIVTSCGIGFDSLSLLLLLPGRKERLISSAIWMAARTFG